MKILRLDTDKYTGCSYLKKLMEIILLQEDETTSAGENILLENSADSGDKSYLLQETYIVGDASTTTFRLR